MRSSRWERQRGRRTSGMEARRAEWKSLNSEILSRNLTPSPARSAESPCGRGLIQSGGVLYFTDEEKYWINWPLKSRGDIPLLGGKLFPAFPDDGATKLRPDLHGLARSVLFYYGKKWDDRRWNR